MLKLISIILTGCLVALLLVVISTAQVDVDPPHLVDFDFAPKWINVTTARQTITFTAHITDNLVGLTDGLIGDGSMGGQMSFAFFLSPSRQQWAVVTFAPDNLDKGDSLDGVYISQMYIPRHSELGNWAIDSTCVIDDITNKRCFYPGRNRNNFPFPYQITVSNVDLYHILFLPVIIK